MGGLERDKYSLLTVYLMATDDQFNVIGDLYLYLKPDDCIYKVCGEAMNVNRIDLKVHDTKAITYKEGDCFTSGFTLLLRVVRLRRPL